MESSVRTHKPLGKYFFFTPSHRNKQKILSLIILESPIVMKREVTEPPEAGEHQSQGVILHAVSFRLSLWTCTISRFVVAEGKELWWELIPKHIWNMLFWRYTQQRMKSSVHSHLPQSYLRFRDQFGDRMYSKFKTQTIGKEANVGCFPKFSNHTDWPYFPLGFI